jgi:hypothetical protein
MDPEPVVDVASKEEGDEEDGVVGIPAANRNCNRLALVGRKVDGSIAPGGGTATILFSSSIRCSGRR